MGERRNNPKHNFSSLTEIRSKKGVCVEANVLKIRMFYTQGARGFYFVFLHKNEIFEMRAWPGERLVSWTELELKLKLVC